MAPPALAVVVAVTVAVALLTPSGAEGAEAFPFAPERFRSGLVVSRTWLLGGEQGDALFGKVTVLNSRARPYTGFFEEVLPRSLAPDPSVVQPEPGSRVEDLADADAVVVRFAVSTLERDNYTEFAYRVDVGPEGFDEARLLAWAEDQQDAVARVDEQQRAREIAGQGVPTRLSDFQVEPERVELAVDGSYQLGITGRMTDGTPAPPHVLVLIGWTSSDDEVVSVVSGHLTAKAAGEATALARAGGVTRRVDVVVAGEDAATPPPARGARLPVVARSRFAPPISTPLTEGVGTLTRVAEEAEARTDRDRDGVADARDNCAERHNPDQLDGDRDGIGDLCDPSRPVDVDGDGIGEADNCPLVANPDQADGDGDSVGDACDPPPPVDSDGDGTPDFSDNCPRVPNPGQEDTDRDGTGDACQGDPVVDTDGDGVEDGADNCRLTVNTDQADDDRNGVGDACDPGFDDPDGDGIPAGVDNCPGHANPDQTNADGDGQGDACDDTGDDVTTDAPGDGGPAEPGGPGGPGDTVTGGAEGGAGSEGGGPGGPQGEVEGPDDRVIQPPDQVTRPPDSVIQPPDSVIEPPDRVIEPPDQVTRPPEDRVVEPPDPVIEPPDRVIEPPDEVTRLPDRVVQPPDGVIEPPDRIVQPPERTIEPPDEVTRPSQVEVPDVTGPGSRG